MNRSSTVGIPSVRTPPPGFSISFRRTGVCATHLPEAAHRHAAKRACVLHRVGIRRATSGFGPKGKSGSQTRQDRLRKPTGHLPALSPRKRNLQRARGQETIFHYELFETILTSSGL